MTHELSVSIHLLSEIPLAGRIRLDTLDELDNPDRISADDDGRRAILWWTSDVVDGEGRKKAKEKKYNNIRHSAPIFVLLICCCLHNKNRSTHNSNPLGFIMPKRSLVKSAKCGRTTTVR